MDENKFQCTKGRFRFISPPWLRPLAFAQSRHRAFPVGFSLKDDALRVELWGCGFPSHIVRRESQTMPRSTGAVHMFSKSMVNMGGTWDMYQHDSQLLQGVRNLPCPLGLKMCLYIGQHVPCARFERQLWGHGPIVEGPGWLMDPPMCWVL